MGCLFQLLPLFPVPPPQGGRERYGIVLRKSNDAIDYQPGNESVRRLGHGDGAWMLHSLTCTLLKLAVASLIVGTILAHFGITADQLLRAAGLSFDRV